MERKHGNQLIGIVLILAGIYWACKAFDLIQFSISFRGWWTLLIIIPCLLGLKEGKSRPGNIVGLFLGVMLLLWRQNILPGNFLPAIILGLVFVFIGLYIMFGSSKSKSTGHDDHKYNESQQYTYQQEGYKERYSYDGTTQSKSAAGERENHPENNNSVGSNDQTRSQSYSNFESCPPNISAILVGKSVSCLKGVFKGTNVQAVLGNVQLDLRQAELEQDVFVNINLMLGGADIYLPENVRVICETQSILGDVRDVRSGMRSIDTAQPAIHITGTCILGGLELK